MLEILLRSIRMVAINLCLMRFRILILCSGDTCEEESLFCVRGCLRRFLGIFLLIVLESIVIILWKRHLSLLNGAYLRGIRRLLEKKRRGRWIFYLCMRGALCFQNMRAQWECIFLTC